MMWAWYLGGAVATAAVLLWLLTALDLAFEVVFRGEDQQRRGAAVIVMNTGRPAPLARRTVPRLRAHRPLEVIEAQRRWRTAAEAHRRLRQAS